MLTTNRIASGLPGVLALKARMCAQPAESEGRSSLYERKLNTTHRPQVRSTPRLGHGTGVAPESDEEVRVKPTRVVIVSLVLAALGRLSTVEAACLPISAI